MLTQSSIDRRGAIEQEREKKGAPLASLFFQKKRAKKWGPGELYFDRRVKKKLAKKRGEIVCVLLFSIDIMRPSSI